MLKYSLTIFLAAICGFSAILYQSPANSQAGTDWTQRVTMSKEGGHVLGNPLARKRLVEYVSYTCPHCATYSAQSADILEKQYVTQGKVSIEVRNFVRDPFDLAAALLSRCGSPKKFFGNHRAILAAQKNWVGRAQSADAATKKRWQDPDLTKRLQSIASDVGLRALMNNRGYDDAALNTCLANAAERDRLIEMTRIAATEHKVTGTPGFLLNDKYLPKTHSWGVLEPKLRNALQGI